MGKTFCSRGLNRFDFWLQKNGSDVLHLVSEDGTDQRMDQSTSSDILIPVMSSWRISKNSIRNCRRSMQIIGMRDQKDAKALNKWKTQVLRYKMEEIVKAKQ